jgi:leader peptidase (prepilin peptidase)/N-methyltransferase
MLFCRDLTKWQAIGCAAAGLATAIAAYLLSRSPTISVLTGYLLFTAAAIMIVDYRNFIIPDELSLPAIPLGIIANSFSAGAAALSQPILDSFIGGAVGGASFYVLRAGYRRFRGFEGLGMGDVKLAAAAGTWVGLEGLPMVLILATTAAVAAVLVAQARGSEQAITRTTPIPFGSFLAPALWLVWSYFALIDRSGG